MAFFILRCQGEIMTDQNRAEKNYTPLIWILSIAIYVLIFLATNIEKSNFSDYNFSYLPSFNASVNSISFFLLLSAFIAIKNKKIVLHKRLIFSALLFTTFFLVSYLIYHSTTPSTKFGGEGFLKAIYLFVLLTHIILAGVLVPFVLVTLGRGLNMNVPKHRKIARWVMPMWLYVSFTGVLIYILISPYYS